MENFKINNAEIHRGDIFFVNLPEDNDSVQGGYRPCVVVQNDKGNNYSPNVILAPLTTRTKKKIPTHVLVRAGQGGLKRDSTVLAENIMTISKSDLGSYVGRLDGGLLDKISYAIAISLGIIPTVAFSKDSLDKISCVC